jgi:coproporphyrinogen III oxidase
VVEPAPPLPPPPQFVRDVGHGILPSWAPIVEARRAQPFTEEQRQWQLLRRGRYLEFNLLYDRGVKFGLDGGRWVQFCPALHRAAANRACWRTR